MPCSDTPGAWICCSLRWGSDGNTARKPASWATNGGAAVVGVAPVETVVDDDRSLRAAAMLSLLVSLSELRTNTVTAPARASTMASAAARPTCQVTVGRPAVMAGLYGRAARRARSLAVV